MFVHDTNVISELGEDGPSNGRLTRSSVSRDKTERAGSTRRPAGVVGMIDAIHDRHLGEIERADPVQASHIDGIQVRVGSPLMMGVDSAAGTEEVLRRSGVEAVAC